ncbi:Ppx/GppA phosphatase family protein [Fodinibius halophilus]|uniref:Ppx/GppA family phosphatase n=1 Tax=Fodinibius halophilus TaxID=1736908 RepID=A0A6M1T1R8_9BACT|nr:Ppx/GppA phosphatase family protein [Fodinibius halophilus]NGP87929.1 Ppx/GppA family phosphatase [Fodinibius halophilus]
MRASIDIGTNTALLLVAKVSDGELEVLYEEQCIPRLGEGVDKERNLSDKAIKRVTEALTYFKQILSTDFPEVTELTVTATSAVRDANNKEQFIEHIRKETGLSIQVLSGYEEAQYTFWGAQSVLPVAKPLAVVDIGGGSTELAVGSQSEGLIDRHSFDMGCVRFTERFLTNDPPSLQQIEECRAEIKETLSHRSFNFIKEPILVGVAGTVTSLAYMELELPSYDRSALNGCQIEIGVLQKWIAYIRQQSSSRLVEEYLEVMKGRADIFLAGLLILEQVMEVNNFEALVVSIGGIRHGAILKSMK